MSEQSREIRETIQKLAGTHLWDKHEMFPCTVTNVDAGAQTCDCIPIGGAGLAPLMGVLLTCEANDGLLLLPIVGSTVMVIYSTNNEPFVAMFSELDKVFMVADTQIQLAASTLIQLNDGSYGGLVRVQDLFDKINRLEKVFNNHTHATAGTGSPSPPIAIAGFTDDVIPIAPLTQQSDIENTKITHGV